MTCARLRVLSMVLLLRCQYHGFPKTGGESRRRSSPCCWRFNMLLPRLLWSSCRAPFSVVCASISVQILFWGDYVAFHHLYSWQGSGDQPAAHNGCFINQPRRPVSGKLSRGRKWNVHCTRAWMAGDLLNLQDHRNSYRVFDKSLVLQDVYKLHVLAQKRWGRWDLCWHLTLPLVTPMSLLGLHYPPSKIFIKSVSKDKSRKERGRRRRGQIDSLRKCRLDSCLLNVHILPTFGSACTVRFHPFPPEDRDRDMWAGWPLISAHLIHGSHQYASCSIKAEVRGLTQWWQAVLEIKKHENKTGVW